MINKLKNLYKFFFWSPERRARSLGVLIGKGCDIQNVNFGSEPYLITIGNHVQITSGTKFFTHGGAWVLRDKYPSIDFFGKISVGDNVYIGNNSMILPGVTIGSNVIVAAGSVVTKSIASGTIVGGNPAKVIGSIDAFERSMLQFNVGTKDLDPLNKRKYLMSLSPEHFITK